MSYRAAKISFDGSHYIATPKENFPQGHKRRRATRPLTDEETEKKAQFEAAYKESQQLPHKERKAYMRKAMEETIPDKEQRKEYVGRYFYAKLFSLSLTSMLCDRQKSKTYIFSLRYSGCCRKGKLNQSEVFQNERKSKDTREQKKVLSFRVLVLRRRIRYNVQYRRC